MATLKLKSLVLPSSSQLFQLLSTKVENVIFATWLSICLCGQWLQLCQSFYGSEMFKNVLIKNVLSSKNYSMTFWEIQEQETKAIKLKLYTSLTNKCTIELMPSYG